MSKTNAIEQRRRAFAEYIAAGKSGVDAARLAGFKGGANSLKVTASRLLTDPNVQEIIRAVSEKASQGRVFDAAARREILRQIAQGEIVQEITGTTPMGSTSQSRRPTSAERVAAIKHLDELDGLIIKKVENNAPVGPHLDQVDMEKLNKRLAELTARRPKEPAITKVTK